MESLLRRAALHVVVAQSVGGDPQHLRQELVAGLDGVPELDMAHDEQVDGCLGHDSRRGRAAIQHADFAEEPAWPQRWSGLAIHLDVGLAVEQQVEAVARTSLTDQRAAGFYIHLIDTR